LTLFGPQRRNTVADMLATEPHGIATTTARYVDAIKGSGSTIVDTRKTVPGLRLLDKYAVRCGGGLNHRFSLSDGVLVQDNHLAAIQKEAKALVTEVLRKKTSPLSFSGGLP